jgi:probable rRNA maturation factor
MSPDDSSVVFRRTPRTLRRAALREFAALLKREVTGGGEFVCLLTGDRELRRLNRQFLGKDYPTDVLSFPHLPGSQELGEMAISVGRAAVQAAEFGHDVETEIRVLMLHGTLHLMGMDHASDRGRMAREETRWRRRLGLPAGLIERAGR